MSLNASFLSNSSLDSVLLFCSNSSTCILISNAFYITRFCLLLPLSILILYLGHRQWRLQHSFKTMSHSDIFTYHNALLELIFGLGTVIYFCGLFCDFLYMIIAGVWLSSLAFSGETFFHLLTCVERYLAVVYPITYLGLRNVRGIRIRNISIGCAWLLSFIWTTIINLNPLTKSSLPLFFLLVFSIVVISFCSLSVLCVLIHPGPGEGSRDRERVDQSKQRMFFTIMAITGVLWLWFAGMLISIALDLSPVLYNSVCSVVKVSGYWFSLPSSLVLPLLYLHRMGKLSCCCYKIVNKDKN